MANYPKVEIHHDKNGNFSHMTTDFGPYDAKENMRQLYLAEALKSVKVAGLPYPLTGMWRDLYDNFQQGFDNAQANYEAGLANRGFEVKNGVVKLKM